jgi:hypothetical protein
MLRINFKENNEIFKIVPSTRMYIAHVFVVAGRAHVYTQEGGVGAKCITKASWHGYPVQNDKFVGEKSFRRDRKTDRQA